MNSSESQLDSLLNDIESNCDMTLGSEQCRKFYLACLSLIKAKLPPIALEALRVLSDYLVGPPPLRLIAEMLEKLWHYLRKDHRDQDSDDPEVSAIRAVICALYAQEHPEMRDIVDHLSFFLGLVNNVEPHYEEEEALLRKHFTACLGA